MDKMHSQLFPVFLEIWASHGRVVDTAPRDWWPHSALEGSGLKRIAHLIK